MYSRTAPDNILNISLVYGKKRDKYTHTVEPKKFVPDTRVLPSARPIHIEGGSQAALILHGYASYPGEFSGLAEALHREGFTVSVPRLPGHGTNREDFLQSTWRDWLRKAVDSYLELLSSCEVVYPVGLSMGGVLALLLAAMFGPERIALLAPAVTNKNKLIWLTPLLKYIIPRLPGTYKDTSGDPDREYLQREYWQYKHTKSAAEVFKLQRMARRNLHKVEADILTVVSRTDPTVSWKVAEYIEKRVGSSLTKSLVLPDGPHILVRGKREDEVIRRVVDWFTRRFE
jgi:carboxylesterase